jgi:multiple sugar transport system substrate-binding protein
VLLGAGLPGAAPLAGFLSACGSAGPPGPPGSPGPPAQPGARSDGPATVVVRNGANQAVSDFFTQQILPTYKEQAPNRTIELEWVSTGPLVETLPVSRAAGTEPDAFWIGGNWMPSLALNKLARDLTAYVRTWGQERDYYPGTIQTTWNKKWNVGWVSNCDLYIYRKDLFAEAGLPSDPAQFPTTWESFADAAARLTRRQGEEVTRAGVDVVNLDFREWRSLFWQTGQEEWNADQTKAVFNNQQGVDALTYLQDVLTRRRVAPPAGMRLPTGSPNLFAAGQVAIQRVNPRVANQVRTTAPEMWVETGIGVPHRRARQVTHIEADGWALSPGAREPDAAFAFVAFLNEPDQMLGYNELQGQVPPRKSLAASGHMQQPYLKTYAEAIDKYGHPYRLDVNHPAILKSMVDDVMSGKKAVKQSLDDAVQAINLAFEQLPAPPQ